MDDAFKQLIQDYLEKNENQPEIQVLKLFDCLQLNDATYEVLDNKDIFNVGIEDLLTLQKFSLYVLQEILQKNKLSLELKQELKAKLETINFENRLILDIKEETLDLLSSEDIEEEMIDYESVIIEILHKYHHIITNKFKFFNYTKEEMLQDDFRYQNFFREINQADLNDLSTLEPVDLLIFLCSILGDIETLKKIKVLEQKINLCHPKTLYTPFMYASKYGKIEVLKYLLSKKANINYYSVQDNKNAMTLAIENAYLEVIHFLFSNGASVYQKDILILAYQNKALDVIQLIENYYFVHTTFGKYHISDIIQMFIPQISLNMPYEINQIDEKNKKKPILHAIKYLLKNQISVDDVISYIDLSKSKKHKEGILFTKSGIYINYLKDKTPQEIYQPYFVIDTIDFNQIAISIDNICSTNINQYPVHLSHKLAIPFINNLELFKCLYTINDVFKRA